MMHWGEIWEGMKLYIFCLKKVCPKEFYKGGMGDIGIVFISIESWGMMNLDLLFLNFFLQDLFLFSDSS
jgi:hypothetical protein